MRLCFYVDVSKEKEKVFVLTLSLVLISSPPRHPPFPCCLLFPCSCLSPSLHSSRLSSSLGIFVPAGSVVLFFYRSSGHEAQEICRVYKALCLVNKDKLFLSPTSKISNSSITFQLSTWRPVCISTINVFSRILRVHTSAFVHVCLCGWTHRKPGFLPGIIDLTNCRPCFILRKWQEQSGETEPGD